MTAKSALGWIDIYLTLGTLLVCAYLVWSALRDARRDRGAGSSREWRTALGTTWRERPEESREEGWTPDVEPWRPPETGGWQEDLDGSWSPDDNPGGGVRPPS